MKQFLITPAAGKLLTAKTPDRGEYFVFFYLENCQEIYDFYFAILFRMWSLQRDLKCAHTCQGQS
jgi:hypothetical protein